MNDRVGKKSARSDEQRRRPSIGKITDVLRESHNESRQDRERAGLTGDDDVAGREIRDVTLDHQEHADAGDLGRFVAA
jgi:hypothetical protein